jgi:hypothetical protein
VLNTATSASGFSLHITSACSNRGRRCSTPAHRHGGNNDCLQRWRDPMLAAYILGALGLLFLILGAARLGGGIARRAQARAWLLIGVIFTVVSAWLLLNAG